MPFCFTCSYSERCVRRRAFGKENEPAGAILIGNPLSHSAQPQDVALQKEVANGRLRMRDFSTKEIFHRKPAEDFSRKRIPAIYCPGDSAGVSAVPAGDSVLVAGASVAAAFISVAAGAVVGAGVAAGVTVSVFCSQAARRAAPARMQMYFFIVGDAYCFNRSIAASAVFGPRRMLLKTQMARHED